MADSNPGMDNETIAKQLEQKRQSIQHVSFGIQPTAGAANAAFSESDEVSDLQQQPTERPPSAGRRVSLRPPSASGRTGAGEQNQQQVFSVSSAVEPPSVKLAAEQLELTPLGPAPAYGDADAGGRKALEAAMGDARPPVPNETSARGNWGGKLEFIMTMISNAVGLGNVWRFPYLCYKNGGGAFLIPYAIFVIILGIPLFVMESAVGQFASLGPVGVFNVSPLFRGLGHATVVVCWVVSMYYIVICAECVYFLIASFSFPKLRWAECDKEWATEKCFQNKTTPAQEFYERVVLMQTEGIHDIGGVNWYLLLALVIAWIFVGGALIRGVQSLGKVVYFTALFPYVMLTILLVRGLTLDGSIEIGLVNLFKPDFQQLMEPKVWSSAATQVFYSTSVASGAIIAMASYNKFSNNIYRDAYIVVVIDSLTSVFSGSVVFSILGYIAKSKNVSFDQVAIGGPGLTFQVYPEALSLMPVSQLWSVLFFAMMCTLGFGTEFALVECVVSTIKDELGAFLGKDRLSDIILRLLIFVFSFFCALPMIMYGGIYILTLIDEVISTFPLLIIGLLEIIVFVWIYGYNRFAEDMYLMTGSKPNWYLRICLQVIGPIAIFVLLIVSIYDYQAPTYGKYEYPGWALAVGWLITIWPVNVIPAYMIYYLIQKGSGQVVIELTKPDESWGPSQPEYYARFREELATNPKFQSEEKSSGLFASDFRLLSKLASRLSRDRKPIQVVQLPADAAASAP